MFVQLTSEGNLGSEVALNYMYNNAFAGKYGFGMAVEYASLYSHLPYPQS